MNLLQRLKIETVFAHDRAEEAFDLQTRTRSLRAYRDLLAQLYGFHAAWEPRAEAALADAEFFRARRKVDFLRADLLELGMAGGAIGRLALCDPNGHAKPRRGLGVNVRRRGFNAWRRRHRAPNKT
jgi:heme oxygenase